MGSYSSADLAKAAGIMSSARGSFTRQSSGAVDAETSWLVVRERIARTLVADPDVAFYLLFLCSNKARKAAIDMAALLSAMVASAEGSLYSQQDVPASASAAMASATSGLTSLVAAGTTPSADLLARAVAETKAFAMTSLAPNAKTGTRLQARGSEAAAGYTGAKSTLSKSWTALLRLLGQCAKTGLFDVSIVKTEALRTPAANLSSVAATSTDNASASTQLLRLLAGAAAVSALGREFDPLLRLHVEDATSFPTGLKAVESTSDAGMVRTFTLSRDGSPVDPRLLCIAVGDLVAWSVYTATVSAVGSSGVSLESSTIPTGTTGTIEVLPYPVPQYRTLRDAMSALLRELPTASALLSKLQTLEGTSAGEVRDRCAYLAGLAAKLDILSSDTLATLDRLGAEEPVVATTAAEALLAYAPTFPEALKKDGRASLDSLKFGGFDRAETLLLELDIDKVMDLTSDEASYIKRILKLSTPFASTTTSK